jgi:hypothetical protein
MQGSILRDTKQCGYLKVNRRFGGTYRFHLQVQIVGEARNQQSSVFCICDEDTFLVYKEAICSFRSSADFTGLQGVTSEDRTVHNQGCQNFTSSTTQLVKLSSDSSLCAKKKKKKNFTQNLLKNQPNM